MRSLRQILRSFSIVPVLMLAAEVFAQSSVPAVPNLQQGIELIRQSNLQEAERVFLSLLEADKDNPDLLYYLALSRSRLGRLDEARSGFERVLELDPRRADACFEIAACFLKSKDYPQALSWTERGLQFSRTDPYGLELAGTVLYLMDSKIKALHYWNQLDRPHLTELDIHLSHSQNSQRIAEEIHLVPGDILSAREIEAARWRLQQHRYIRSTQFQPVPGPSPDQYALKVDVDHRRAFGSLPEFLFNSFSGVGFRTLRLTYWDLAGTGITTNMQWRWRTDALRAQADFDMPRPAHLPVYAGMGYNWRQESWYLSGYSSQPDPDINIRYHEVGLRALIPVKVPQLSFTAGFVARRRTFESSGAQETATARGGVAKDLISISAETTSQAQLETARRVVWLRFAPLLQLRGDESPGSQGWQSRARAALDFGRSGNPGGMGHSRLSGGWQNRYDWFSGSQMQRSLVLGVHAGRLSEPGLFEDHFILGVGPDVDFWLRAHPFLRAGKPGRTPLAGQFALCNLTAASDIKSWKWLKVGVVAFLDVAQVSRAYPGQMTSPTPVDTGVGLELGSRLVPARRFTFAWGYDAKSDRHVFYVTTSYR